MASLLLPFGTNFMAPPSTSSTSSDVSISTDDGNDKQCPLSGSSVLLTPPTPTLTMAPGETTTAASPAPPRTDFLSQPAIPFLSPRKATLHPSTPAVDAEKEQQRERAVRRLHTPDPWPRGPWFFAKDEKSPVVEFKYRPSGNELAAKCGSEYANRYILAVPASASPSQRSNHASSLSSPYSYLPHTFFSPQASTSYADLGISNPQVVDPSEDSKKDVKPRRRSNQDAPQNVSPQGMMTSPVVPRPPPPGYPSGTVVDLSGDESGPTVTPVVTSQDNSARDFTPKFIPRPSPLAQEGGDVVSSGNGITVTPGHRVTVGPLPVSTGNRITIPPGRRVTVGGPQVPGGGGAMQHRLPMGPPGSQRVVVQNGQLLRDGQPVTPYGNGSPGQHPHRFAPYPTGHPQQFCPPPHASQQSGAMRPPSRIPTPNGAPQIPRTSTPQAAPPTRKLSATMAPSASQQPPQYMRQVRLAPRPYGAATAAYGGSNYGSYGQVYPGAYRSPPQPQTQSTIPRPQSNLPSDLFNGIPNDFFKGMQ